MACVLLYCDCVPCNLIWRVCQPTVWYRYLTCDEFTAYQRPQNMAAMRSRMNLMGLYCFQMLVMPKWTCRMPLWIFCCKSSGKRWCCSLISYPRWHQRKQKCSGPSQRSTHPNHLQECTCWWASGTFCATRAINDVIIWSNRNSFVT